MPEQSPLLHALEEWMRHGRKEKIRAWDAQVQEDIKELREYFVALEDKMKAMNWDAHT